MSPLVFRLLDANLNRASEGLRVLEDISRFILDNETYSRGCKRARHELARLAMPHDAMLLAGRDSTRDVGREAPAASGGKPRDLLSVVRANAKRVEESLRVLEELSRGAESIGINAIEIERIRYSVYELEKGIATGLLRRDAARCVRGLYVIVDRQAIGERAPVEVARDAIAGGSSVIQLRDKLSPRDCVYRDAAELSTLCEENGVLFVVNDHVDVAAAVKAPAVHVGQDDLPVAVARRVVPATTIVGVSCHTLDEVERAVGDGADYIAVGAVFPTARKDGATVVGLKLVRMAKERVGQKPLVAIGGIDQTNVAAVIEAGADAVAVISAVVMREDVNAAAREMCAAMCMQD